MTLDEWMQGAHVPEGGWRVGVTGWRYYPNRALVWAVLDTLHSARGDGAGVGRLAHGATPTRQGADWHSDAWAQARGIPCRRFWARRDLDGPLPGAGPNRNRRMWREFAPHVVVAFPGENGTARAREAALEFGIPVVEIEE